MPYVLVVDDDTTTREMISAFLKRSGYETCEAADGENALDKIADDPPDLIILDIEMPILDGYETLARLKSDCATRNIPVIVLSAHHDLDDVKKALDLGAFDHIGKPTMPFDLLRAVRSASSSSILAASNARSA